MKRHIKYKQLFIGLATLLTVGGGMVAVPVTNALTPFGQFAAAGCPDGQTALKVERNNWKDATTCCPTGTETSENSCLFGKYVNPVIKLLSAVVGVIAVIAIIVGGVQYSSSAGDPQKAAAGKKHIMNALIGLLAYLFLFAFLQFIVPGGVL